MDPSKGPSQKENSKAIESKVPRTLKKSGMVVVVVDVVCVCVCVCVLRGGGFSC